MNQLKDQIKDKDAKIMELTKKNQELENKLKAFKGIQIETHDREVFTEFSNLLYFQIEFSF